MRQVLIFGFETAWMWEKGNEDLGTLASWQNLFIRNPVLALGPYNGGL